MFNIVVDELADGGRLLYNSFTGVLSEMDAESMKALLAVESMDVDSADDKMHGLLNLMERAGYTKNGHKLP